MVRQVKDGRVSMGSAMPLS